LRSAISLAVVLVVYWAYALTAVPLIEPSARRESSGGPSPQALKEAGSDPANRLAVLAPLFPPGSSLLKNAKMLESDQVKLLLRDYTNFGDGRVQINPCVMIYTPEAPDLSPEERIRQAVVLEAPEGALLQFDQPLDLGKARIGRLVNGHLHGPIRIRSEGKHRGPEDHLLVLTRDLDVSEERIWTGQPVEFHMGANSGSGQEMLIKLLKGEGEKRGPNIGGMQSLELRRQVQMHLEVHDKNHGTAAPKAGAAGPAAGSGRGGPAGLPFAIPDGTPIEATCQGPFHFDPVQQFITLEDRVDVMRLNPSGPSDQINCDLLTIFLSRPRSDAAGDAATATAGSKKKAGGMFDLQPRRFEAKGNPVVIRAPSQGVNGRGQRLEYDLITGQLGLEDRQEAWLQQENSEIHCRNLQYQSAGPGKLGRVTALGPGWLRGQVPEKPGLSPLGPARSAGPARQAGPGPMPNQSRTDCQSVLRKPPQVLEARWTGQLRVQPYEQEQLISLIGGAGLKFNGMGELAAEEIWFWLFELPKDTPGDQPKLRPDRMMARQQVRLESPQMSGRFEEMAVWFVEDPAAPNAGGVAKLGLRRPLETTPAVPSPGFCEFTCNPVGNALRGVPGTWDNALPPVTERHGGRSLQLTSFFQAADQGPGEVGRIANPPYDPSQRHFDVEGRQLQARVLMHGDQSEVVELIVKGAVRMRETQTAAAEERPVLVIGDQVQMIDVNKPCTAVMVTGEKAHFEGRGMSLDGSNINLNRGTNRLWVDGPGQMDLPMDKDLDGHPLDHPATVQVQWQRKMNFDGCTARFEESVTASMPNRQLRTETLDVTLQQPIVFADANNRPPPQVSQLQSSGGVALEGRTFDERGPQSIESFQAPDLTVNMLSGRTHAGGPGWLTTIRRGSVDPLQSGAAGPPAAAPPAAPPGDPNQLTYLNVAYQGSIEGNIRSREMTFLDHVAAVYGPVDSWDAALDPNNLKSLGDRGMVLHCEKLTVTQMSTPGGAQPAMEMVARDHALLENIKFTARAARISYTQAKGLLILEGDGRSKAELSRQKYLTAAISSFRALKIEFWPATRSSDERLRVDGADQLDFNEMPPPRKPAGSTPNKYQRFLQ
jgi:hypothetical protein